MPALDETEAEEEGREDDDDDEGEGRAERRNSANLVPHRGGPPPRPIHPPPLVFSREPVSSGRFRE